MGNYFYDMLSKEDLEKLVYLPTIPELLEKCKKEYASLPAISDKNVTYTYDELYHRVAKRREYIYSLGISEGSNIAILARNDIDAMELFLAITTAGYTVLMLPNMLDREAVYGISKIFELAGMFVADEFMNITDEIDCPVWKADSMGTNEAGMANVTKDTVAAIYFTGGTTGAPKGAVLSHGALMRGAFNGALQPGELWNNIYIAMLPLSHIFGSVRGFLSCLYTGSLIYTCTDMRAAIADIPVCKPTQLVMVPGLVEIILNIARAKGKAFLGNLRTIICGAAPVPPRLMTQARSMGLNIYAGYGLTEGANLTSGNVDTDIKPDSMGKIYPEQEYKVVNGELWIKGDNLMKGYYKNPEKTAEIFEDGWLKTGDLVEFDDDGYIYITGRIKNLIILSNGENVSPEEIEELFYKEKTVKDCLVSEMEMNGNKVIGIEILPYLPEFAEKTSDEIEKIMREVVEHVNSMLPAYKRVMKLVIRNEDFKRTGAMKIARN